MKRSTIALRVAAPIFGTAIFILGLMGCSSKPIDEMILADAAVRSAQKAKADAVAVDAYRKAENFYLRAKRDYADGYYDAARKHANEARILAEKAEFKALQKQTAAKPKPEADTLSSDPQP